MGWCVLVWVGVGWCRSVDLMLCYNSLLALQSKDLPTSKRELRQTNEILTSNLTPPTQGNSTAKKDYAKPQRDCRQEGFGQINEILALNNTPPKRLL